MGIPASRTFRLNCVNRFALMVWAQEMPARNIQPFMVDTCHSELDGQIDRTIRIIAINFDLPTMPR
ncbi:hypothetical protein FHS27_005267 [Rhodopirellula rubra]|uniref:Uncharacterized protein n=1 Tax=Aporhodopirellula rubra TaxID=980271 RepID=A0A7W5E402_9BACT|nr:hypothetical protein [Aporhodopirellula rubra]